MVQSELSVIPVFLSHSVVIRGGQDQEETIVPGGNLLALALRYVTHREAIGCLNRRSAQQMRHRLIDFASHVPADPLRVRRRHVELWMERPGLSPQYRRTRLSAVRGFCRWCVANGHMKLDPTLTVEAPKIPPALPKRMTGNEARRLAHAAKADRRTLLIVLLMLQEGLRRIEVSRLNVEDVDFAERTMRVRSKGGAGAVVDCLPITDETWRALTAYLAAEPHNHGPLLRNRVRAHGRLSASTISELVRRAMVDAGVKKPGDMSRTPHSCRHTAAHDLLERTRDVRAVQQALRHRSVRSTEVYLRGHSSELRPILEGRTYL